MVVVGREGQCGLGEIVILFAIIICVPCFVNQGGWFFNNLLLQFVHNSVHRVVTEGYSAALTHCGGGEKLIDVR